MTFEADIDKDSFIKKDELLLASKLDKGEAEFNKFLTDNYADLEMLSRQRETNYDRGISYRSFVYLRDAQSRNKLLQEAETNARLDNREFAYNNFGSAVRRWGGLGMAIEVGACFLPAKYRVQGYLLGAAVGVCGTVYSSVTEAERHEKENAQLIDNQRKAIERINRNLTP